MEDQNESTGHGDLSSSDAFVPSFDSTDSDLWRELGLSDEEPDGLFNPR